MPTYSTDIPGSDDFFEMKTEVLNWLPFNCFLSINECCICRFCLKKEMEDLPLGLNLLHDAWAISKLGKLLRNNNSYQRSSFVKMLSYAYSRSIALFAIVQFESRRYLSINIALMEHKWIIFILKNENGTMKSWRWANGNQKHSWALHWTVFIELKTSTCEKRHFCGFGRNIRLSVLSSSEQLTKFLREFGSLCRLRYFNFDSSWHVSQIFCAIIGSLIRFPRFI